MNFNTILIIMCVTFQGIFWGVIGDDNRDQIITAIADNGCSSHQELSQTKSNADVYNYAALSTDYKRNER